MPTNEDMIINSNSRIVNNPIASKVDAMAINISLNDVHDLANLNILNILNVLNAETAVNDPPETELLVKSKIYSTIEMMTIKQSNTFIESLK